jgi:hypothetical protein
MSAAEFSMLLRIVDVDTLVTAAVEQAIREGISEDDARETYTAADLDRCLVMLLDPSSLAGCEILESNAEVQPGWGEIDIQVFAMHGDRIAERGETIDYWDILVRGEADEGGDIPIIEEHDNLTLEQVNEILNVIESKYDNVAEFVGG